MTQKQIKNITDRHYKQLNKLIKKIDRQLTKKDIHQFRVEYKQLRAFLRMISMECTMTREIKIGKNLKNTYHILGTIRDLQLQIKNIRAATKQDPIKPKEYLSLLQKEINKLQITLVEILLNKPVTRSQKKTDALLPKKFPLKDLSIFIKKKQANINAIITAGNFRDDNIHTIRKQLKDLYYNLNTFEKIRIGALSIKSIGAKNKKYLHDILNSLGNFQDRHIEVDLLKSAALKSLNTYNQELLIRIKKSWLKDKANMKQLLVNKMKAEMNSLPPSDL